MRYFTSQAGQPAQGTTLQDPAGEPLTVVTAGCSVLPIVQWTCVKGVGVEELFHKRQEVWQCPADWHVARQQCQTHPSQHMGQVEPLRVITLSAHVL